MNNYNKLCSSINFIKLFIRFIKIYGKRSKTSLLDRVAGIRRYIIIKQYLHILDSE